MAGLVGFPMVPLGCLKTLRDCLRICTTPFDVFATRSCAWKTLLEMLTIYSYVSVTELTVVKQVNKTFVVCFMLSHY